MWTYPVTYPLKATERSVLVVVTSTINNLRGISHETKKRKKLCVSYTQRGVPPKHFWDSFTKIKVTSFHMSNLSLWSSYKDVSHPLFPLVPVSVTELKSAPLCWLPRKSASSWPFKSNLNSENMLLAVFLPPFLPKHIFLVWCGSRRCSSLSLPSHSLSSLLSLHDFCKNPPTARSPLVRPRSSKPSRNVASGVAKCVFQ